MVKTQKSEYGQMAKIWNGQKLKMWIEKKTVKTQICENSQNKKREKQWRWLKMVKMQQFENI